MAIGDDATGQGYPLVPDTGSDDARVRWGAREINRTRDFIAQVKASVLGIWPVSRGGTGANNKSQAKINLGFSYGTSDPTGGENGDIYFKVIG